MKCLLIIAALFSVGSAPSRLQRETPHGISSEIRATTDTTPKKATISPVSRDDTCIGVVYYRTSAFVSAAHRAGEAMFDAMRASDGRGLRIAWVYEPLPLNSSTVSWEDWDDYVAFYHREAPLFSGLARSRGGVCVVLAEIDIPTSESRVLGSAAECHACAPDYNVAFVRSGLDSDTTFGVILHEIGHLFCAPHLEEDLLGVMSAYAGSSIFSDSSMLQMRRGMREKFDAGVCISPSSGILSLTGAALVASESSASHACGDYGHHVHDHSHGLDTYDDYDVAVAIVFFVLVFFALVSLIYWGCATV